MNDTAKSFRFNWRTQDVLLALMLGALTYLTHDVWQMAFMGGLAVLQLVEGRIPWLDTTWGRATSVVLQLVWAICSSD